MVLEFLNRNSFRLLWLADVVLSIAILLTASYTEIDWKAYMQEVEGFLGGDMVYTNLRGDTGPLVYPAGFVYIFSALYYICDKGRNIALAQCIFLGFYLCTLAVILKIYNYCKVPFIYTIVLIASKRIHSIFLLRMFNDGVAMMLVYIAIMLFASRRWSIGCVFYSLAVSVKMNIFLFAPGLLCVLVMNMRWYNVIKNLAICALVQVVLGLPFLATDPVAYLGKAFELSRVFDYKWTVNYKFMAESAFVSKYFGYFMLAANITLWVVICKRRWIPRFNQGPLPYTITRKNIVVTLFESNLIGFACCRSMHYQFYVWAFHQLPLVLSLSLDRRLPAPLHLVIYSMFEYAFNTYPSTSNSSFLLMVGSMMPLALGMVMSRDALVPNRQEDFTMLEQIANAGPSPFDVKVQHQTGPMPLPGRSVAGGAGAQAGVPQKKMPLVDVNIASSAATAPSQEAATKKLAAPKGNLIPKVATMKGGQRK